MRLEAESLAASPAPGQAQAPICQALDVRDPFWGSISPHPVDAPWRAPKDRTPLVSPLIQKSA